MSEANIFIIVNLGCEMLYVIDQRLRAQQVSLEKSTQVMRDITSVLLDPKFIERLILGSHHKSLITSEHCRFMLNDITCCSLMRLDEVSMGKLWDLMTMIFKWQLFVSKHPQHLLDITFRHLDGVGQLFPEVKKSILVDYTKNNILDLWNQQDVMGHENIFKTIRNWLDGFSVKISILIRLGFQLVDGSFVKTLEEEYFQGFVETAGENIYNKSSEIAEGKGGHQNQGASSAIDNFADQLKPSGHQQTEIEGNIVFEDLLLNIETNEMQSKTEFVQLMTAHSPSNSWENFIINRNTSGGKDLNSLLKTKLT